MKTVLIGTMALLVVAGRAVVAAPAGYFEITTNTALESGDTWISGGKRYRLYGLQSCLRGTPYTDASGNKRDCGDASLAVFAAFVKDTHPICAPVAGSRDLTFAVCYATVGDRRLDLALMMITEGYGFASLDGAGLPVHAAYAVAEQNARISRRGLWRFDDVQHPAMVLGRAAKDADVAR